MRAYTDEGVELAAYDGDGASLYILAKDEPVSDAYPTEWVALTTVLDTFDPQLEIASDATVWWEVDGVAAGTGLSPALDFGTEATRTVRFGVTHGNDDRLDLVTTINLGYDITYDQGYFMAGEQYNRPAQGATAIANLGACTGLVRFLAEVPPHFSGEWAGRSMTGVLDFTGMADLEFIDCFFSYVEGAVVAGCDSLIRLELEATSVNTTIDLDPVRTHLRDFRASSQRSGFLHLAPLSGPMAVLYHFCVHDQPVTNWPAPENMPAIEEWLIWNNQRPSFALDLTTSPNSVVDIHATPELTSIDLAGQFPAGVRTGRLIANDCSLTGLDVTDCGALGIINLQNNLLSSAAVDALLVALDGLGETGGQVYLSGNGVPTSTGLAAKASLESRSWTVEVST